MEPPVSEFYPPHQQILTMDNLAVLAVKHPVLVFLLAQPHLILAQEIRLTIITPDLSIQT